ncbi:hypothetical protein [Candidatus Cytomitobacter indipagum]|uniref:hypothetical protein n=1 Tax=Candidatus Cytomitobacter indipagum TaxID=2601575 RepID=UPI00155A236D|nr:hypothetical protein [Candidatus Cytomitobacter indipagum]
MEAVDAAHDTDVDLVVALELHMGVALETVVAESSDLVVHVDDSAIVVALELGID